MRVWCGAMLTSFRLAALHHIQVAASVVFLLSPAAAFITGAPRSFALTVA